MVRSNLKRHLSAQAFIGSFLLVALAAVSVLALGCSDNNDKASALNTDTGAITTKTKEPVSKQVVETLVTRKLGDAGAAGLPVIRSVTLTPEANGTFVNIELNRTESCHAGALVGTAVTMSQQVMSALFRYPDVSRVQMSLYGTTEAPADKDTQAVRVMVTKDAASKIDWFQFKDTTVSTLASEFWVEPMVYANWQQYGAAPIDDEATRAAANNGVTTPAPTATTATP
ncbi:MAG: hypothetical protein WC911_01490 [Thermoleophilia bacterium]